MISNIVKNTMYYYIGIVIVGVIFSVFLFSSISSDTWKDWRTGFTGVAKPDELNEQIDCLSKNGIWKNNSCNFEDKSVKTEPVKTEPSIVCSGVAKCFTGIVTKIVDGDTLDIDRIRIRISLTNTPERGDDGFSEAAEFTKSLCPVGSTAHVDQDDLQPYDKFGRMLGKVICLDKVLNSELLESKHATILTRFCSTSEFSSESWAKKFGCE